MLNYAMVNFERSVDLRPKKWYRFLLRKRYIWSITIKPAVSSFGLATGQYFLVAGVLFRVEAKVAKDVYILRMPEPIALRDWQVKAVGECRTLMSVFS